MSDTLATSIYTSTKKEEDLGLSLLIIGFLLLIGYRTLGVVFHTPVWFDEIVAKAFIFGLPLWIFAWRTKKPPVFFGFDPKNLWFGAFHGLAIGGLFGFIAMFASSIEKQGIFIPGLFASSAFWNEFGLAFATAFWESLFFYSLALTVFYSKYKDEWTACCLAMGTFLLFHAPILLLRGSIVESIGPLFLLAFFSFGQAVLFLRTRSISSVIISHAFWGMALLVYGR